ncbi:TraR/DksA C4-type zinc finger protein [Thermobrachium celere]|uniref:TraR/DksA C4-type zinc finger protein n=1 Tax=Thermobrachium celere TaxID=53422 RepID=UPI0019423D12|nr:TraR/DksA C4-type zinc finger protein [Thermobrachium celere]GFR35039.1 molecular chaperone DnaK [Thermobrachium celere]
MQKDKYAKYKQLLLKKKEDILHTINQMEENGVKEGQREELSELSTIDNHPADMATEVFDKERGFALFENEKSILAKIDQSLKNMEDGTYGLCEICGGEIEEDRLEVIPYASTCKNCMNDKLGYSTFKPDRPVEEEVLGFPFGRSFRDVSDENEYDGEDAWQEVGNFNRMKHAKLNYDDEQISGTVEWVENISNQQYKNQLP